MRQLRVALVAVVLGLGGVAAAQSGTSNGPSGTNSPGEGRWGGATEKGNANNTAPGTGIQDPTGMSGNESRVSGSIYGATRGPGANEIQPDRGDPRARPAAATARADGSAGHVPTNQEIARGAAPAIQELPPVPRPIEERKYAY